MNCLHPPEELQRVYEGGVIARNDRLFCGLCGDLLYVAVAHEPVARPAMPPSLAANQRALAPAAH